MNNQQYSEMRREIDELKKENRQLKERLEEYKKVNRIINGDYTDED